MGASIASLMFAAPASADFHNAGGEIGIVDTNPATPDADGATLLYPGQTGDLADIQLLIPNKFESGDTIRLALYDRAAGPAPNADGQANTDAAHKINFTGTPAVEVKGPFETATTIGVGANETQGTPGPLAWDPTAHPGLNNIPVAPQITATLAESSAGQGNDLIDLKINNSSAGSNQTLADGARWVINLSDLQAAIGEGATPGELRIVPFSCNGVPNATNCGPLSAMFGNIGVPGLGVTSVTQYTVPAYIAPVTFNVAEPSALIDDGTTQNMGDITIAETNNFSLQDGTYTLHVDHGVVFRNGNTGDPITATVTNPTTGGTPTTVTVNPVAAGDDDLTFTLTNWSQPDANQIKSSIVLHGVQLAETGAPGDFTYTLSGGSIGDAGAAHDSAFLVDASTSEEIPSGYGGSGANRRGVPQHDSFYNGSSADLGPTGASQTIPAPALTFGAQSTSTNKRIGGIDRYGTAAKVAMSLAGCGNSATCPNGVGPALQSVVLASGENFPDALSGNFLAGSQQTAILLTRQGSLPQATEDALCELGVQRVFIVGGTAAVSTGVENTLKGLKQHNQGCNGLLGSNANIAVTRLAGADRYATNRVVNEYASANNLNATSVGLTNITFGVPAKRTALVATGANFPDALAAGPATVFGNFPIVLARGATLGSDGAAQFSDLGLQQAVIVGGTDVVSTAAESEITSAGAAVKRIAGADRYETATKLADFEITPFAATSSREGGLGFDSGTGDDEGAILSTGVAFADALAGGPLAAQFSAPILLTTPNPLSAVTQKWLTDHASTYRIVQALGLGAAISDAALTAANQAVSSK